MTAIDSKKASQHDFMEDAVAAVAQLNVESTTRFKVCLQQLAEAEHLLSGVRGALADIYGEGKLPYRVNHGGTLSNLFSESIALSRSKVQDRPEELPQSPLDQPQSLVFPGRPLLTEPSLAPKASPDTTTVFAEAGPPDDERSKFTGNTSKRASVSHVEIREAKKNEININKKFGLEGMLSEALSDPTKSMQDVAAIAEDTLGIPAEDFLKCRETFDNADLDKSGIIEIGELKELLEAASGGAMTDKEFKSILRKFDANNDGGLDFEEFLLAFSNTPKKATESLKVQIDTMANADKVRMAHERLAPRERVWNLGVPDIQVKKYLRNELQENDACFQIPVIIILFLSWFIAVYFHYRLPELHSVEEAVRYDVRENANFAFAGAHPFDNGRIGHKNIDDVNTIADFWSWFDLGLVNLFFPEDWDVSETRTNVRTTCSGPKDTFLSAGYNESQVVGVSNAMPDNCPIDAYAGPANTRFENPTYMLFNTIVGGVRLRQEVMEPDLCLDDSEIANKFATLCFRGSFDWLKPELHNVIADFEDELVNLPGSETVYLPSRTSRSLVRRKLHELENKGWLSPKSTKVEVMFTTHNPHEDVFVVTIIRLYMNRAGRMHKVVEPVGIWIYPFHGWQCYFFDAVWVALTLKLIFDETHLIFKHTKKLGIVRGIYTYASPSNIVDWTSILYSLLIGIGFAYQCALVADLRGYLSRADLQVIGSWTEEKELSGFYDLSLKIVILSYRYRSLLMGYPFVIGARLFKAFDAQPRLAMVTRTMQRASTDILHFGVVLFCAFLFYTSSAMIMFGSESLNFATPARAFTAVFVMLIGGFDWEDLNGVGLPQAMLWFWSFMILLQLIMLNMLLAIVMDVYTEVKSGVGEGAETMYTQMYEIFRRWDEKRRGHRVSLEYVLSMVEPEVFTSKKAKLSATVNEVYTVKSLMTMVPELNEKQAERILISALEDDDEDTTSMSLADTANRMQNVEERVDEIHDHIARQFQIQQMMSNLLSSTTKDITRLLEDMATSMSRRLV